MRCFFFGEMATSRRPSGFFSLLSFFTRNQSYAKYCFPRPRRYRQEPRTNIILPPAVVISPRQVKRCRIQSEMGKQGPFVLKPRDQNPLKFLELLVKGLCPIIQDQVDVNHQISCDDVTTASGSGNRKRLPTKPSPLAQHSASKRSVPRTNHKQSPRKLAMTNASQTQPFEIAQRPPSDMMGISMKMWEGICSHSSFPSHKSGMCNGFCRILTDRFGDEDFPPDGEECSVSTTDSTAVDLSPQFLSHSTQQECDNETFCGGEDDEECLPMAEFQQRKSYRGTQVLVVTILALCITLAILRNMGPAGVLFVLESKSSSTPQTLIFAVSHR